MTNRPAEAVVVGAAVVVVAGTVVVGTVVVGAVVVGTVVVAGTVVTGAAVVSAEVLAADEFSSEVSPSAAAAAGAVVDDSAGAEVVDDSLNVVVDDSAPEVSAALVVAEDDWIVDELLHAVASTADATNRERVRSKLISLFTIDRRAKLTVHHHVRSSVCKNSSFSRRAPVHRPQVPWAAQRVRARAP